MKKFLLSTLLILTFTLSAFTEFRYLDTDDPVRVMQRETDGTFSWETFESTQACMDHYDIERLKHIHRAGEIVFHYETSTAHPSKPAYVHIYITPEPNSDVDIRWNWIEYPFVYFHDDHEHIYDQDYHPPGYHDFISYMEDYGWIDVDDTDLSFILSIDDNLQEMIDAAREAWGLAIAPDNMPPVWRSHIQQHGGDWVKYGDNFDDYYIAIVDITPSYNFANPTHSAYFRKHNVRRYQHTFDDNDIKATLNYSNTSALETNDVFIDYRHDIVNIKMANGEAIVRDLRNLTGLPYVSFEAGNKWYIAQVRSVSYAEETIILNCVAKAKQGDFSNNESLTAGIEQINDDD